METKSRYEVIANLESQKRQLIVDLNSFDDLIAQKVLNIKTFKRELEDAQEDLENFKKTILNKKETTKLLIASVEDALKRFEVIKLQS